MNEILEKEYVIFQNNLADQSKVTRKRFHFNSVSNIYNSLIAMSNTKADKYKQNLLFYFYELNDTDYQIKNKVQSISLYKDYLVDIGKFLMKEKGFKTSSTLYLNISIGLILDLILIYAVGLFNYPVFTVIALIISVVQRYICIRKKKYFSIFW